MVARTWQPAAVIFSLIVASRHRPADNLVQNLGSKRAGYYYPLLVSYSARSSSGSSSSEFLDEKSNRFRSEEL